MRAQREHRMFLSRLSANQPPQSTDVFASNRLQYSEPPFPPIIPQLDSSTSCMQADCSPSNQYPNGAAPLGNAVGSQSSGFQSVSPQRFAAFHQNDVAPGNMAGLPSPGFQSASAQRSVLYLEKRVGSRVPVLDQHRSRHPTNMQIPQTRSSNSELQCWTPSIVCLNSCSCCGSSENSGEQLCSTGSKSAHK